MYPCEWKGHIMLRSWESMIQKGWNALCQDSNFPQLVSLRCKGIELIVLQGRIICELEQLKLPLIFTEYVAIDKGSLAPIFL